MCECESERQVGESAANVGNVTVSLSGLKRIDEHSDPELLSQVLRSEQKNKNSDNNEGSLSELRHLEKRELKWLSKCYCKIPLKSKALLNCIKVQNY